MRLYNVAICEDDAAMRDGMARRCREILRGLEMPCSIMCYASAEELEAVLSTQSEPFDLLLLDVQLPGKTGTELGATLRSRDDKVGIIFITGSAEYALEGYKSQPCNYLLKPVSDGALKEALCAELRRHGKNRTIAFQDSGYVERLYAADILYFEGYDHGIRVQTVEDMRFFSMSLSQVEDILPVGMFARCHKSYIVNLSQIKSASSTKVVLRGGVELPVGRAYRDEFHRVFIGHFF